MGKPRLTFFCELKSDELDEVFSQTRVLDALKKMNARVSLGIPDFSARRSAVVKQLNAAEIPVIAWLLLPQEQGYWFNANNIPQCFAYYAAFKEWTASESLEWCGIGLDFEPDIREMRQLAADPWPQVPFLVGRAFGRGNLGQAASDFNTLIARMRLDGYPVDGYKLPLVVDERQTNANLLAKLAHLPDIATDREVLMLYTSYTNPQIGPGFLWNYAPHAQAIGLGSTGGGVSIGLGDGQRLSWGELARDLRLAWYWTDEIYIFSLEGCVRQDFLDRLASFVWDKPILFPVASTFRVKRWRSALQVLLWISAHPTLIMAGILGSYGFYRFVRELILRQRNRR